MNRNLTALKEIAQFLEGHGLQYALTAVSRQLMELAELIELHEVLPRLEACRQKAAE